MKLFYKLIFPSLLLLCIGLGIVIWQNYILSNDSLFELNEQMVLVANSSATENLAKNYEFDKLNAISFSLSTFFKPYLAGHAQDKEDNLPASKKRVVDTRRTYSYGEVSLVDKSGKILLSSNDSVEGNSVANRDFFKKAMQGNVTIGNPFKYDDKIAYSVAAPIYDYDAKTVIGVIYIFNFIDAGIAERLVSGKFGTFMVVDSNGLAFLHNDSSQLFKFNVNKTDILRNLKAQNNFSSGTFTAPDGREKIAYVTEIEDLGWKVINISDLIELEQSSINIRNKSIYLACAIALCIAVAMFIIIRHFTKQIELAAKVARDISIGKLDNTIRVKSNDEIGILSKSLMEIPVVLKDILREYQDIEALVSSGQILDRVDAKKYQYDFATIVSGTNNILDKFTAVFDYIPLPIIVLDKQCCINYMNSATLQDITEDNKGKDIRHILDFNPHDLKNFEQVLRTKTKIQAETNVIQCDIVYSLIPMLNEKNDIDCIVMLVNDVTKFKAVENTIADVVKSAQSITGMVSSSITELTNQVKNSETSANLQESKVATANDTMDHVNIITTNMAQKALDASNISKLTKEEANNGSLVVQKAIDSINIMQEQSQHVKQGMSQLSIDTNAINNVITTISDIADQTNLLALNAAIEAARAGESGRGFAVVADEVRKLAEKTMESTEEVKKAIVAIQTSVSENVSLVDTSVHAINSASSLVNDTGLVFENIVNMVDKTAESSSAIAAASNEQVVNNQKVKDLLVDVNDLAHKTAEEMKESSFSVAELSKQGQNLAGLMQDLAKVLEK